MMSEWKNQVVPHWLATCTCCDRNCLSSARGQVRAFADEGRMSAFRTQLRRPAHGP
jgi:hypothetical protein